MNLARHIVRLDNPLDRSLLSYFEQRPGRWIRRQAVMRACGFDDPIKQPVGAYAQFASTLIRVNREIAPRGLRIMRDEEALDLFALQDMKEYGKDA
ncbi:hypothetical protein HQ945_08505 [Phyllobacterium sp. BT25]|uniref:Uncharacterized protein n=1 Tax=Phyllobacterium pellucidum TaxID=2740464 RepID=A0A849VMC3_9HYPH|nr:hypothetical protein [Phyllobacterium pellucidum]NTS31295.1 hypothetical protein [Phyllobacterium pellucidum]